VEPAHGGRGHSSSRDRHSSHSNGRAGRGVSRRSEYRGVYIFGICITFHNSQIWPFQSFHHEQFVKGSPACGTPWGAMGIWLHSWASAIRH